MSITLENSILHRKLCEKFLNIKIVDLINYYFIGPNACGKRTFIECFINNLIGYNCKTSLKTMQIKVNNNLIDVEFRSSNYHYEINIYEYGLYDKIVLSEFMKMVGETKSINSIPFKIIILYGFDKTNKQAQLALRRMIESYSLNLRIFLVGNSYSKIDKAILSRFKTIYLPFPDNNECIELIKSFSHDINPELILSDSYNDLNRLINLCKTVQLGLDIEKYNKPYYHLINNCLTNYIFNEKWVKINEIRELLLNIVLLNIDLCCVLKNFIINLITKLNDAQRIMVIDIASEIDRKANIITWNVFVIEYFLLKIKSILNLSEP